MTTATAADRSSALQQQARALGDPTRFAMFQYVVEAAGPIRVAELTKRFAVNHNAVRQHLAKLCETHLLVEESAPRTGPGRPALQYRAASGVPGTWATQGPYEQLATMLLEILVAGRTAREVGRAAGARSAVRHGAAGDATAIELLGAEMQRRGFEPRHVAKEAGDDLVLDFCPFASAAAAQPGIVCELHRGLAEGFVDSLHARVEVTGLIVRKPERAGCRLQLRPVRGT